MKTHRTILKKGKPDLIRNTIIVGLVALYPSAKANPQIDLHCKYKNGIPQRFQINSEKGQLIMYRNTNRGEEQKVEKNCNVSSDPDSDFSFSVHCENLNDIIKLEWGGQKGKGLFEKIYTEVEAPPLINHMECENPVALEVH